jgi:hypothetical protein
VTYATGTSKVLLFFLVGLIIFFTGETMHRDREVKVRPIVWSMPAPNSVLVDLKIVFKERVAMSGVVLMSRQNHREHEGDIKGYALLVSDDGNEWRDVARGELLSTFAPQHVYFTRTETARYLKLIALSGFGNDKTTSLAEIAVIPPDSKRKPKPSTRPNR